LVALSVIACTPSTDWSRWFKIGVCIPYLFSNMLRRVKVCVTLFQQGRRLHLKVG